MTCATVCLEVGKLSNSETALESRNVIIIQCTVYTAEESTVVTSCFCCSVAFKIWNVTFREELLHQVRTSAVTTPSLVSTIGSFRVVWICVHILIVGRSQQEECSTPACGLQTILQEREDTLVSSICLTVIAHEEHLVSTPTVYACGVQLIR